MVAVFPGPHHSQTALFPCLKPCQPAPGIATAKEDCFDRPTALSKRCQWGLDLLFGVTQAAAISLGLWASSLIPEKTAISPVTEKRVEQQASNDLWRYLASEAFAEDQLAARAQLIQQKLTAAEQARWQAQQLRINAEQQAENLTADAAQQARQTTMNAIRRADLIHLDASYIGAEQVIYAHPGEHVTLKFTARIQCKDGNFGETATASPVDGRITPREIRNLAACYPSAETPAGKPIGAVGEWGVAFFKLE